MRNTRFLKPMAILAIAFFFLASCDDEFNEVGGSLVGDNNFDALLYKAAALDAHSLKLNSVQSNGLSSYALGFYKDPKYGATTANVLAQLELSTVNPTFGDNPQLDSVVLTVPYFSTIESQTLYDKTYTLDSVFGDNPVKLSIYESNYYLRQYDPADEYNPQAYYSDQGSVFEQNLGGTPLYVDQAYKPSSNPIVLIEPIEVAEGEDPQADTTKLSPRLRVKLPVSLFQQKILDQEGNSVLATNSNFQNYFRGLYFKSEALNGTGMYALLNFASDDAGITLYFHTEYEDSEGETQQAENTYALNFGSQIVNTFDTDYQQLPAQDDNLYVKGGQGSMAVVNLFTDQTQLDSLREANWLINEANLKLYVNADAVPTNQENPGRLYIYDVNNSRVLKDYSLDAGINENDPWSSRLVHLGRIEEDENGNKFYRIRITNYVNDIINNDSTNTRLGVVVSQNVNVSSMSKIKADSSTPTTAVEYIPTSSVLAREGTVFYGPEAPDTKALKLEIYYTKLN